MTAAPEFAPTFVEQPIPWCIGGVQEKTVTTLLETTPTPGLAIGPVLQVGGFTGEWAVTHLGTGRALLCTFDTVQGVREFARLLGTTGIDWTAGADSIRAAIEALPDSGAAIRGAWAMALAEDCQPQPWDGF